MNNRIRGLSIRLKIIIVTSILVMCTIGILNFSFLRRMQKDMVDMGVEQARIAARMAVQHGISVHIKRRGAAGLLCRGY